MPTRTDIGLTSDLHSLDPQRINVPRLTGLFDMEIITAEFAYITLKDLRSIEVEEFWALALGPTKSLLRSKMIFRGTVDACLVHPRDIFRFACLENASSLVVAHNHPSGDTRPSEQDLVFTHQLIEASRILEIPVIDHLIITHSGFSSFAREGWCQFPGGRELLRKVRA